MRYKCSCQYDGSSFCGWQRQPRVPTVQGTIEKALQGIYFTPITIHGASRTDKGVHALDQVFHFDAPLEIPLDKLMMVVNRQMPPSVQVTSIERARPDFHSRYDCIGKAYQYQLETQYRPSVFRANYVYHYGRVPDVEAMKDLARYFLGSHDFKAFMASGSDKENTVRTLYQIDFTWEGTLLVMTISGSGFLYNMVRIMMGMFLDYSEQKYSLDRALNAFKKGDRQFFRRTAPAAGLYLTDTRYP